MLLKEHIYYLLKLVHFTISLHLSYMEMYIDNLLYLHSKEKEIENSFLKLTICLFLLFLCFIFSLSWKFWPQLDSKYASFLNIISV